MRLTTEAGRYMGRGYVICILVGTFIITFLTQANEVCL